MNRPSTVYIVADDPATGESLAATVLSHGLAVQRFPSSSEALASLRDDPPGCLIVDLGARGQAGIELHGQLAEQRSTLPVIILSSDADVPMAVAALKQGVFMLLPSPCSADALCKSVAEAVDYDAERRQRRQREEALLDRYATLSEDEHRVLKLIVAGLSNKAIASQLNMPLRTVEARRASVLRKMAADSVAALVRMTAGLCSS